MRSIVWSSDQEWCWVKVWIIELRLPWSLGLDKPASDERMGITHAEAHIVSSTRQYAVSKRNWISATTQYTKVWLKPRCCCGVTYLAFLINSTCLLELPLLSITVANCIRKHRQHKSHAVLLSSSIIWKKPQVLQQCLKLLVKICSPAVIILTRLDTQWFAETMIFGKKNISKKQIY